MPSLFTDSQLARAEAARADLLSFLWKDPGWLRCYDIHQLDRLRTLSARLADLIEELLEQSRVQVHEDDGEVEP